MHVEETSPRDVQLLLWAVGQARDQGRQQARKRPVTLEELRVGGVRPGAAPPKDVTHGQ